MGIELDEQNELNKVLSPNYPEHNELIRSMQAMGYYGNIRGVCAGIAELANLFCVMGKQEEFKLRMRLIKSLLSGYKLNEQGILKAPVQLTNEDYKNLKEQFAKVEAKLAKQGKEEFNRLTTEEQMIYEVVHFLQDIQLHYKPHKNPELFNEGMDQHKVEEVSKLTIFKIEDPQAKFKGIEKVCTDPTVKTKVELDAYFTDLEKDIKTLDPEMQKQLSFTIDSLNHRIMVNYQGNNQWLFVDANQLGESVTPVATADIGKKIRDAMEPGFPDEDRFPLNITTYATHDKALEVRNKLSSDPTHKSSPSKANKITLDQAKNIVGRVHDQHMDLTKIKKVIGALYINSPVKSLERSPAPFPTGERLVTEMETLLANGSINKGEYIKFVSGAMELNDYKKLIAVIIDPLSAQPQDIQNDFNHLSDKKSQFSFTKKLLKSHFTPDQLIATLHKRLEKETIHDINRIGRALIDSYNVARKKQVLSIGAEHGVNIIKNHHIILQGRKFPLDAAFDCKEAASSAVRYGQAAFIKEMRSMIMKLADSDKFALATEALSKGKTEVFKVLEQEHLVPNKPLNNSDNLKLAKAAAEGGCFEILKKLIDDRKIDLSSPHGQEIVEAAITNGRFQELAETSVFKDHFNKFLVDQELRKSLTQYAVSNGVRGVISGLIENSDLNPSVILSTTLGTSAEKVLNDYTNIYNATHGAAKNPTQEQQEKLRDYPQIMAEIALGASRLGLEEIVTQCYEKCLKMEELVETSPTIPPVRADEMALNAMRILIANEKEFTDLSTEIATSAVDRGKSDVIRELLQIFAEAKLKNKGALPANCQAAWDKLATVNIPFDQPDIEEIFIRNNLRGLEQCKLNDYNSITNSITFSAKENWDISDMVQWQKELDERLAKVTEEGPKTDIEEAKKYAATMMDEIITAAYNAGTKLLSKGKLEDRALTPNEMTILTKYAVLLDGVSLMVGDLGLTEIIIESYNKIIELNESSMQNRGIPLFDMEATTLATVDALLKGIIKDGSMDVIVDLAERKESRSVLLKYIATEATKRYLEPINNADNAEKYKEILTQIAASAHSKYQTIYNSTYGAEPSKKPTASEKKDLEFFSTILINIHKEETLREIVTEKIVAPLHERLLNDLNNEFNQIHHAQIKQLSHIKDATNQYDSGLKRLKNLKEPLNDLIKVIDTKQIANIVELRKFIEKKESEFHSNFQQRLIKEIRDEIQLYPSDHITKSETISEAQTRYDEAFKPLKELKRLAEKLPAENKDEPQNLIKTIETKFEEKVAVVENIKAASERYVHWSTVTDQNKILPSIAHTANGRANAQSVLDLASDRNKPILEILEGTQIALGNSKNHNHSYSRFLYDQLCSPPVKTVGNDGVNKEYFGNHQRADLQNKLEQFIIDEKAHKSVPQNDLQVENNNLPRPNLGH